MNKFGNLGIKSAIVVFWVAVITTFLFIPLIKKAFIKDNAINIFAWVDMIDPVRVAEFEKETGIKVNINYYESYQELLAKFRVATPGDYDLIMITEYALKNFPKNFKFKQLDKSKLDFWDKIEPRFLNHYFDPENKTTIPFFWDVYGIGVNKKYIQGECENRGWDLIFDPNTPVKPVVMINEALETLSIAALYLYGKASDLTTEQITEVKKLLIKQKTWVEAYTDLRADYYLIAKISPAVVAQSAYINRALVDESDFCFIIPTEGSFVVIDSIVIPESSTKDDSVYKFINFLYKEDVMDAVTKEYAYLPVLKPLLESADLSYLGKNILSEERFSKFHFFGDFVSADLLNELWIKIKSA